MRISVFVIMVILIGCNDEPDAIHQEPAAAKRHAWSIIEAAPWKATGPLSAMLIADTHRAFVTLAGLIPPSGGVAQLEAQAFIESWVNRRATCAIRIARAQIVDDDLHVIGDLSMGATITIGLRIRMLQAGLADIDPTADAALVDAGMRAARDYARREGVGMWGTTLTNFPN